MNCAEAEVLIQALIDEELDAGHAREVEMHAATCPACADKLSGLRAMRAAMVQAGLTETAPALLRSRIEAALSVPPRRDTGSFASWFGSGRASRRTFFGGFAAGAALSAAVAASLVLTLGHDEEKTIEGEIVSAHLRSLQAGHLTDVETSDRHTVKPWFNGKLDVAPPVVDLTAQGFTLIGGRLDYINGEAAAAIVYRRRNHLINLFIARRVSGRAGGERIDTIRGFNVQNWAEGGLEFWSVSDINVDELREFGQKFRAALAPPAAPS